MRKPAKKVVRQHWTNEDKAELRVLFKSNFLNSKCPRVKQVEKAMKESLSNHGSIHKRTRDNIKKKVHNMIVADSKAAAEKR